MKHIAIWMLSLTAAVTTGTAVAGPINWALVDQAIGRKGTDQPGGVHKYSFPRSDLKVTVDGVPIKPGLALGGWVAFEPMGSRAMVMGDLVLTETEISPVMQRLIAGGVQITALHNHLLRTSVPVYYMHVGGLGNPVELARALHDALSSSATPLGPAPAAAPQAVSLDTTALDRVIGSKGKANGGVYQYSMPRAETIKDSGMKVPPSMGTAISINFEPTSGGKAAITGDFVLLGREVNPVLKALRENGIEVTTLHSHMIEDSPHLFFMHFGANDDATRLAQGLRAALNHVHLKATM